MTDEIRVVISADDAPLINTLAKIPGRVEAEGKKSERKASTIFGAAGAAAAQSFQQGIDRGFARQANAFRQVEKAARATLAVLNAIGDSAANLLQSSAVPKELPGAKELVKDAETIGSQAGKAFAAAFNSSLQKEMLAKAGADYAATLTSSAATSGRTAGVVYAKALAGVVVKELAAAKGSALTLYSEGAIESSAKKTAEDYGQAFGGELKKELRTSTSADFEVFSDSSIEESGAKAGDSYAKALGTATQKLLSGGDIGGQLAIFSGSSIEKSANAAGALYVKALGQVTQKLLPPASAETFKGLSASALENGDIAGQVFGGAFSLNAQNRILSSLRSIPATAQVKIEADKKAIEEAARSIPDSIEREGVKAEKKATGLFGRIGAFIGKIFNKDVTKAVESTEVAFEKTGKTASNVLKNIATGAKVVVGVLNAIGNNTGEALKGSGRPKELGGESQKTLQESGGALAGQMYAAAFSGALASGINQSTSSVILSSDWARNSGNAAGYVYAGAFAAAMTYFYNKKGPYLGQPQSNQKALNSTGEIVKNQPEPSTLSQPTGIEAGKGGALVLASESSKNAGNAAGYIYAGAFAAAAKDYFNKKNQPVPEPSKSSGGLGSIGAGTFATKFSEIGNLSVAAFMANFTNGVKNAANRIIVPFFNIGENSGARWGAGWARGADGRVRNAQGDLVSAAELAARGITEGMKNEAKKIPSVISGPVSASFTSAIATALTTIKSQMAGIVAAVGTIGKNAATAFSSPFLETGKKIGIGIRQQIGSGIISDLGNKVSLAGGAVVGTENVAKFDAASRKNQTLLPGIDETRKLEKASMDLSKELKNTVSSIDILGASYELSQRDVTKLSDQMKILKASQIAAVGGFATVGEVSKGSTAALKAFGLSADRITDVINVMSGAVVAGNFDIGEFAKGTGLLAPSLALVGQSLEEKMGLFEEFADLTALATNKGLNQAAAFVGVRAAWQGLIKPTNDAVEAIEEYNNTTLKNKPLKLDLSREALSKGGITAVLKALSQDDGSVKALSEIATAAKEGEEALDDLAVKGGANIQALVRLFPQIRALAAIAPAAGIEGLKDFANIRKVRKRVDVQKQFDTVSGGITSKGSQVGNQAQNLDIKIKQGPVGAALIQGLDLLSQALDKIEGSIESLNKSYQALDPNAKKFVDTLGSGVVIVTAFAAAAIGVGVVIGFIGKPLAVGTALALGFAGAISRLAIAFAPIAIPIAAAAFAVWGISKAFGATDGEAFRNAMIAAGVGITAVFGKAAIAAVVLGTKALVGGFISIGVAAAGALIPLIPWIAIALAIVAAVLLLKKGLELAGPYLKAFGASFVDGFKKAWSATVNGVGAIGDTMKAWGSSFNDTIRDVWVKAVGATARGIVSLGEWTKNGFNGTVSTVQDWGNRFNSGVGKTWKAVVDFHVWGFNEIAKLFDFNQKNSVASTKNTSTKVAEWFKWLWQSTAKIFQDIGTAANQMGQNISKGFDTVISKIQELGQWLLDLPGKVNAASQALQGMGGGGGGGSSVNTKYEVASGGRWTKRASDVNEHHDGPAYTRIGGDKYRSDGGSQRLSKDLVLAQGRRQDVPVPSAGAGTAKVKSDPNGYGNYVEIVDDFGKVIARMAHLSSVLVKDGERVNFGQAVGIQGTTGRSTGVHLHVEVQPGDWEKYYNGLKTGKWGGAGGNVQSVSYNSSSQPASGGVMVQASTYHPGGGGINGKEIDSRGKRLTPEDLAVAVPSLSSQSKLPNNIPYGTILKITDPTSGKSVNAVARDSGPFAPGRGLDVTTAVKKAIDFKGLGQLKVSIVSLPKGADPNKTYSIGEASRFGDVTNILPGRQIRMNMPLPNFGGRKLITSQAAAGDEILLAFGGDGGIVSDTPTPLFAKKPSAASRKAPDPNMVQRAQDRVDDAKSSQETAKRDIARLKAELAKVRAAPVRQIKRLTDAHANKIKKIERQLFNAEDRLTKAIEREKRKVRDKNYLTNPSDVPGAQLTPEQIKEKEIGEIKKQVDFINTDIGTEIDYIEKQVDEGKITKQQGEIQKNKKTVLKSKRLAPLLAQVRALFKKYGADPDAVSELRGIESTVFKSDSDSAKGSTELKRNALTRFEEKVNKIIGDAEARAIIIREKVSKNPATQQQGEFDLNKLESRKAQQLNALRPELQALQKKKEFQSPEDQSKLLGISNTLREANISSSQKNVETTIAVLEAKVRKINEEADARAAKIRETVSKSPSYKQQGDFELAQNESTRSGKLQELRPEIQALQKRKELQSPEDQSKLLSISNTLREANISSIDKNAEVNISTIEDRIKMLIAENDSKSKIVDFRSSETEGITPEGRDELLQKGLEEKVKNLQELSEELNKLIPLASTLMGIFQDAKSQASLQGISNTINEQAIAANNAKKELGDLQLANFGKKIGRIEVQGEKATQDVKNTRSLLPEKISEVGLERELLAIKLATNDSIQAILPDLERWRSLQTDPAVIENANELIAKYKQVGLEAQTAYRAGSDIGKTTDALQDGAKSLFASFRNGFKDLNTVLDTVLNKIADMAINLLLGQVAGGGGFFGEAFSFLGFKNGGTIKGYANGGTIKAAGKTVAGALSVASAASEALKKEGSGSVLIAATPDEEMLNKKEGAAYRAMKASGLWGKMLTITGYANGGTIGKTPNQANIPVGSPMQSNSQSSKVVTVDRINSIDYVSVQQLEGILSVQLPATAKAGAALVDRNLQRTNWRQQNGL